ncbi:hypothetical protein Bpfe_020403 [Biomphalaria pfeifferi]|uniref:Uncharacterized protein n=1 Tax=Biomphalaria pfeifferi TaxID=112525 RepID=A0AAD8B8S1_BIOPF|nr:hypothetical protein Bpfe_020403 [Biomphalaria pfeifferi]
MEVDRWEPQAAGRVFPTKPSALFSSGAAFSPVDQAFLEMMTWPFGTQREEIVSSTVSADPPDRRLSRELQVHIQTRCKQSPMRCDHPQLTVSGPGDNSLPDQVKDVFLLPA